MRNLSWILGLVLVACGGTPTPPIDGGGNDGTVSDSGGGVDGAGSDSGGGPCDAGACGFGLTCCGNKCVNQNNDPQNCGMCGNKCTGGKPMCQGGQCAASACMPMCTASQVCCIVDGPGPTQPPKCYDGDTCPVGCPLCN